MKRLLLTLVILAGVSQAQAQAPSASPQVLASAGSYVSAGGISLSYTVGEMAAIETYTAPNNSVVLTQGFQQPNDLVLGLLDVEKGANGSFSVYPIPAQSNVWYGYEFSTNGKVEVNMYNMLGQKMTYNLNEDYESGKLVHSFDCSAYASGNYILSVKFTSGSAQEVVLTKKIQIITN